MKIWSIQRAPAGMVFEFFDKKQDQEWVQMKKKSEELNKNVIEKLKKRKVSARFKDNIWAGDFA